MNQRIIIRQEQASDYADVFEVISLAFCQKNEAHLVEALRKNKKVFVPDLSIVASIDNRIAGHILFTKIFIQNEEGKQHESLALAPVAVLPEFQKRGIGARLIHKGIQTAMEIGFNSVIVLGHEEYYPKFGFQPARKWNIKAPFEVASNAFMALELVRGGLSNTSGTVKYAEEFEKV